MRGGRYIGESSERSTKRLVSSSEDSRSSPRLSFLRSLPEFDSVSRASCFRFDSRGLREPPAPDMLASAASAFSGLAARTWAFRGFACTAFSRTSRCTRKRHRSRTHDERPPRRMRIDSARSVYHFVFVTMNISVIGSQITMETRMSV